MSADGQSPHDVLIEALEHVEEMNRVLVIWERDKPNSSDCSFTSRDSGMTAEQVLIMIELYKLWVLNSMLGIKP